MNPYHNGKGPDKRPNEEPVDNKKSENNLGEERQKKLSEERFNKLTIPKETEITVIGQFHGYDDKKGQEEEISLKIKTKMKNQFQNLKIQKMDMKMRKKMNLRNHWMR